MCHGEDEQKVNTRIKRGCLFPGQSLPSALHLVLKLKCTDGPFGLCNSSQGDQYKLLNGAWNNSLRGSWSYRFFLHTFSALCWIHSSNYGHHWKSFCWVCEMQSAVSLASTGSWTAVYFAKRFIGNNETTACCYKELFSYKEITIKHIGDATNTTRKCYCIRIEISYVFSLFNGAQTV